MTTESGKKEVKQYFVDKLAHLEKIHKVYENALFQGLNVQTPEMWKMVTMQRPSAGIAYLTYGNLIETFEVLKSLAEGILDIEDTIAKLEAGLHEIAEKTHTDISTMKTDVTELQKTMLPVAKGMVKLIDKLSKDEEKWKKNGEMMIV